MQNIIIIVIRFWRSGRAEVRRFSGFQGIQCLFKIFRFMWIDFLQFFKVFQASLTNMTFKISKIVWETVIANKDSSRKGIAQWVPWITVKTVVSGLRTFFTLFWSTYSYLGLSGFVHSTPHWRLSPRFCQSEPQRVACWDHCHIYSTPKIFIKNHRSPNNSVTQSNPAAPSDLENIVPPLNATFKTKKWVAWSILKARKPFYQCKTIFHVTTGNREWQVNYKNYIFKEKKLTKWYMSSASYLWKKIGSKF